MKREFFGGKMRCRETERFTIPFKNATLTAFASRVVGLFYNKLPIA